MYYEGKYRERREKKERRTKNIRLTLILLAMTVFFAALSVKIIELEKGLKAADASVEELQGRLGVLEQQIKEVQQTALPETTSPKEQQPSEAEQEQQVSSFAGETPSAEEAPATEETPAIEETPSPEELWTGRKVYLTFDDGPSIYTTEILDILDRYGVKATFFVLGKEDETSVRLIEEIYERGHTVGMHSYSHSYKEIYASLEAFEADYKKISNFLSETIGIESFCYRFPGGSSNTISSIDMLEFADYLTEREVVYFDWNISSGDGTVGLTAEEITQNVLKDIQNVNTAVVLLHDSAEKRSTVDALAGILEAILAMEDTAVFPISESTQPIQHRQR